MRVLFLSQLIPYPLDAGPKVRSYHVARHLVASGHRVTLVAFSRPGDLGVSIASLEPICTDVYTVPMPRSRLTDVWYLVGSFFNGQPFLIARDWVPGMAALLQQLAQRRAFDAVHADQLWMAPYALYEASLLRGLGCAPVTVLDQHNAVFQIPRRLAESEANPLKRLLLALEARKMLRFEVSTCRQFDHVVWVTEQDRAAAAVNETTRGDGRQTGPTEVVRRRPLGSSRGEPRSMVIPICVDPSSRPTIRRADHPRRVTFLGGLHWPPNAEGIQWFARAVWPSVVERAPAAVLTVIGKNPPLSLRSAAGPPGALDVRGYVADPTPYLAETAAFIVPLRAGGGMRVKILDAWCWGLPVVSTTIGAEGLRYRDGESLLIADSALLFGNAVVRLLTQPELGARIAAQGRQTVEACYDWRQVYQAWDGVYAA